MNAYLQSAREAIEGAVGRLTVEALQHRTEGRWSIAEILEHLTLAFNANAAALQKALASGELRARQPTLKQTLGRILVVDVGYFPRVEAPSMTRPNGTIPAERALSAIGEAVDALDGTLAQVGEKFGADVLVSNHPYFAGMTVRQWQKFHWRHTRHHVKQVRKRSNARVECQEGG
jgi:hypothetical protein